MSSTQAPRGRVAELGVNVHSAREAVGGALQVAAHHKAAALGLIGPTIGLVLYSSAGRDDAHITYWAARALATTGEIVNYNGDRIEQSSSLLHVLLIAVVSRITSLPIPTTGFLITVAAGGATALLAHHVGRSYSSATGWLSGLLTATGAYLTYWGYGGLETTLAALLLLSAILVAWRFVEASPASRRRQLGVVAAVFAAYVLVRPESGLVLLSSLGLAAVVRWFVERSSQTLPPYRGLVFIAAVVYLLVGVGRLLYFGSFLPNTVTSKVGGLELAEGWSYLNRWAARPDVAALLLFALAGGTLAMRRRSALGLLLLSGIIAHLVTVLVSGGDWMEAGRFLVPAWPLAAVLAAVAVTSLASRPMRASLAVALLGLQGLGSYVVALDYSTGKPLWASIDWVEAPADVPDDAVWFERNSRIRVRDTIFVNRLVEIVDALRPVVGRRVVVASGQAGVVPYHLMARRGDVVRFVDLASLSTRDFGDCTEGLRRSRFGSVMSYQYWFGHVEDCGVPLPDIVYDRGLFPGRPGLHGHYTNAFDIRGLVRSGSSLLPGGRVVAAQLLAVRNDLLPPMLRQLAATDTA